MKTGCDRYLEYQYGWSGDFYQALWLAIMRADTKNKARLAKGFPEEVEAYRLWSRVGVREFAEHCSPEHPLFAQFKKEYTPEATNEKP